jgi:NLI interacting factor-like phosphatase
MDPNLTPIASIAQSQSKKNRISHGSASSAAATPQSRSSSKYPHSENKMVLSTPLRSNSSSSITAATPLSELKPAPHVIPLVRRSGGGVVTLSPSQNGSGSTVVTDQVDALFSPVAQFLHEHSTAHGMGLTTIASTDDQDDSVHPGEYIDDDDDDDGSMARPEVDNDDDDQDKFNPWLFISSLPDYDSVVPKGRPPEAPLLPPLEATFPPSSNNNTPPRLSHRKTLVLDLDETLVHCKVEAVDNPDFCFDVPFNGQVYCVNVKCRPHLIEFLDVVSKKFEVVVFTASQRVYAEKLLDILDPGM